MIHNHYQADSTALHERRYPVNSGILGTLPGQRMRKCEHNGFATAAQQVHCGTMTTYRTIADLKAIAAGRTDSKTLSDATRPGAGLHVRAGKPINGTSRLTFALRYYWPPTKRGSRQRSVTIGHYPSLSLAEARHEARRVQALIDRGEDPHPVDEAPDATLERLTESYLAELARLRRPSTIAGYRAALQGIVLPDATGVSVLGAQGPAALTRVACRAAVDAAVERGAPTMGRSTLQQLRQLSRWLIVEGHLDADPTAGLKRPVRETPRERTLTGDEIQRVWRHWDTDIHGPSGIRISFRALQLQLLTCLRPGEVSAASWEHYDPNRRVLAVPSGTAKNHRLHIVPIVDLAAELIDTIRTEVASRADSDRWLFPPRQPVGKPLNRTALVKATRRTIKALDLQHFTPHDLRRTVATELGRLGIAPHVTDAILNHAPTTTSRRVYNRYDYLEEKRDALERWEAVLRDLIR
ncbi:MAG: tyrosine-type recombinase/integrase [Acidobacteriota bacterium]